MVNSTHVNINVSWDSPDDPVTGYVIYYQSEGGPVINDSVSGGERHTHWMVFREDSPTTSP